MIESTFWQAEEAPKLEQGLWEKVMGEGPFWCYSYIIDYQDQSFATFCSMDFGCLSHEFSASPQLWIKRFGATEHD